MTAAQCIGGIAAVLIVSLFAGILIGKWIFLANTQQHRSLRHEHGPSQRDPQRARRLSVGGEISHFHSLGDTDAAA